MIFIICQFSTFLCFNQKQFTSFFLNKNTLSPSPSLSMIILPSSSRQTSLKVVGNLFREINICTIDTNENSMLHATTATQCTIWPCVPGSNGSPELSSNMYTGDNQDILMCFCLFVYLFCGLQKALSSKWIN